MIPLKKKLPPNPILHLHTIITSCPVHPSTSSASVSFSISFKASITLFQRCTSAFFISNLAFWRLRRFLATGDSTFLLLLASITSTSPHRWELYLRYIIRSSNSKTRGDMDEQCWVNTWPGILHTHSASAAEPPIFREWLRQATWLIFNNQAILGFMALLSAT